MRAHFTICTKRPAASDEWTDEGDLESQAWPPPGPRMPSGWRCGAGGGVLGGCSRQTRHLPERGLQANRDPARLNSRELEPNFRMPRNTFPIFFPIG
jgi:hypothetical protein